MTIIKILVATPPRFFNEPSEGGLRFAQFEEVGTIDVGGPMTVEEGLSQAFVQSQNIDEAWNPQKPCRSSSVGDVLMVEQPDGQFAAYEVMPLGFKKTTLTH